MRVQTVTHAARWMIAAAALGLALLSFGRADAEQLALIHMASPTCIPGGLRMACTAGSKLDLPAANDLVAMCPTPTNCWAEDSPKVQRFGDVPAGMFIDGCNNPATPRGATLPNPWDASKDPCGNFWRPVLATAYIAAEDPSVFSASVIAGGAPVSTVLTWDVVGVDTCTASGSWTGSKPVKGAQTISGLTAPAKYTLTCNAGASLPGTAELTWTAPTTNTDGSALSNLAGFRIQYGITSNALANIVQVANPAATAYTMSGLTAGQTWFFTLTAYRSDGAESSPTGQVSKAIAGSPGRSWTRSIDVAVTPAPTLPNPPTGFAVTEKTAYRLDQQANKPVLVAVGTVPIGTPCIEAHRILEKNRVDRAALQMDSGRSRPNVALATCKKT